MQGTIRAVGPDRGIDEGVLRMAGAYLTALREGRRPCPGQAAAWEEFHETCNAIVRAALHARGLSQADVEDCSQEVWLNLLASDFAALPPRTAARRIAAIARNKAADVFRRRARQPVAHLEGEVAAPIDEGGDPAGRTEVLVWAALRELDRRVSRRGFLTFYLRWIKGLPNTRIAALLDMAPAQVRLNQHRVKRVFLSVLSEGGDGPALTTATERSRAGRPVTLSRAGLRCPVACPGPA
jgi:DNA-directed RNA polymerase specialized sigma24 family protein